MFCLFFLTAKIFDCTEPKSNLMGYSLLRKKVLSLRKGCLLNEVWDFEIFLLN